MIRPVTCLAMLMAAGSGLYLYQAKHQANVLDRQIDRVATATARVRDHISVLRAEYALLNDPSRLQEFAAEHLAGLAPLTPGQFTTLAQLDGRLPAVAPPRAPAAAVPLEVSAPAGIGVKSGNLPYDFPPAPPAAVPARTRALIASSAAPVRTAAPAAARRVRPAAYASVIRPLPRRVASFAPSAARSDPLAIPAAAPAPAKPSQVASALGMARSLVAPATVSYYQRYQPGASETLAR